MIKIYDKFFCPIFEYLYLFVMVIYMAQMTPDTGRMVGSLSGNPVPFFIPIVLTIILLSRHPISFNHEKLWKFTCVMLLWSIAVCVKFHNFSSSNLSYYFFLFYAIFIAYIHVSIYGRDLFYIYEHIMVVLATISLILWGLHILLPFTDVFFHKFPETNIGHNVLYLYNWLDPSMTADYSTSLRNAGCSWEPGRFAIMLIPAIYVNLSRRGVAIFNNMKAIILLAALASTMSTTGYSIAILLYTIFWFKKITLEKGILFAVLVLPICVYLFSLDFMAEKIQERADYTGLTQERLEQMEYHEEKDRDEYVGSLDRFESAAFDWMNFQKEPLLGYSRNRDYSWFRREISLNFELTGGLVKIFSQYGLFIGILLYVILFLSSMKISKLFSNRYGLAFAFALLLCSVSYTLFCIPIFTAFWLYGLFCHKDDNHRKRILIGNINNERVGLQ